MEIKDCMYGQVRAIEDNIYRGYNTPGMALPSSIPEALRPHIKEQQVITWNNNTGMNPLWDRPPVDNVIYKSYGEMLQDAYEISVRNGLTYVPDLVAANLTVDQYDQKVKESHTNNYSMICATLGAWWHTHQLLNQPDALDYDYLIVRQMDTWFHPPMTTKQVQYIFDESRKLVLLSPKFENPTMPLVDIPVAWASRTINSSFPMSTWIDSFFFMFNKSTVEILQKDFLTKVLQEIEIFYLRNGTKSKPILGKPGTIFHHVAIKNDITVIDTSENIFCWIPDRRTSSASDYSRNERNVTQVEL